LIACLAALRETFPLAAIARAVFRVSSKSDAWGKTRLTMPIFSASTAGIIVAGKNHLFGPIAADETGQSLGATESGDDAQGDFRQTEHGIFRSVDKITGQGHLTAAPQCKSVNRGNHRDRQVLGVG
jgi:hypothetical protein